MHQATLLWQPPFYGNHPSVATTPLWQPSFCGNHPYMATTLIWQLANSSGARRALRAARDAKRLHRDDDRRLARTIDAHGGYSDTESIVALTDDDDR